MTQKRLDRPVCAVDGCTRVTMGYQPWCNLHWLRYKRSGNPLGTRTPNGEPKRYYDEVVLKYNETDKCLIWPYACDAKGYAQLNNPLYDQMEYVSRILCEQVNGPPPSLFHQAAHSCGEGARGCVTKAHLRWATQTENEDDKLKYGMTRGRPFGSKDKVPRKG